ncbi:VOC family protein [Chitinophaga sp. S165]|uniref:VOC family protein n=1 Tax=Chitinophaga sp. S165 TaxID=2135462 RepID=UPI000D714EA7|nr:VOC family protein [Chitinophaga sp. S165]PWV50609.1 catechol 2,3-dioxygenase-like lactoylglutathione lyase family enzyme [Chitinophaga sp. S165]
MEQRIAHTVYLVKEYDEAIEFFTGKLGFILIEDTPQGDGKRRVIVAPPGAAERSLLLAKAANKQQAASIINQTAGPVYLFLSTDDVWRDYNTMVARQVNFISSPKQEQYGTLAVFEDLYGNQWDLVELNKK